MNRVSEGAPQMFFIPPGTMTPRSSCSEKGIPESDHGLNYTTAVTNSSEDELSFQVH